MPDRTVTVRLQAHVDQFQQALAQARQEVIAVGREMRGLAASTEKAARDMQPLGTAMLAVGAGFAASGVLAVKSAIDFESAFAGVRKTVDGTEEELAALSDGIRAMSRELPATSGEIASVAEAAGALGVETDAILGFTRVMVDLGETTNLTADQAATAFARIANVMGTAHSEFDRMGSTVVALGNNGASTEAEIVELANRLAAAGEIAGLTEANVFAFAETLASVGVEAEAGGTALSKVFTSVRDAVLDGSEKLDVFARVAGTSVEAFAQAFRDDAAGAIASFVEGLGRISDAGQSTTSVFEALELTDQRLMRALQSTGSAGDYLRQQIALANDAWVDNNALSEEAAKRYETTAAQLEILRNNVADLATEVGSAFLPALTAAAEVLGVVLDGVREMPGPMKATAVSVGALVGVVTTLGGGFLFLLPRLQETKRAWDALSKAAPNLATNMTRAGAAVGILSGALVAGAVVYGAYARDKAEAQERTEEWIDLLRKEKEGIEGVSRAAMTDLAAREGLLKIGREFGLSRRTIIDALLGEEEALAEVDAALRREAQSKERRFGDINKLKVAIGEQNEAQRDAREVTDELAAAEEEAAAAGRGSADTQERRARSTRNVNRELTEQEAALQRTTIASGDYGDALDALISTTFDVQSATDRLVSDVVDLAQSVADAKAEGEQFATSLDASTAAGLSNRTALRGIVDSALAVAEAMAAAGQDPLPAMRQLHDSLSTTLGQLGFNETAVESYIGALLQIPGTAATKVQLELDQAMANLDAYIAKLGRIPSLIQSAVSSAEEHDAVRFRNLQGITTTAPTGSFAADLTGAVGGVKPSGSGGDDAKKMRDAEMAFMRSRFEFGDISAEEYKAFLTKRAAAAKEFSEDWTSAMQEIIRVNEEVGAGWKAAADEIKRMEDEWMRVLDVQNQVGDLSNQKYLSLLEERLAGLKEYSSEWFDIWKKIHDLKEETSQTELQILEAVEKQRLFDVAFYAEMDQRRLSAAREGYTSTSYSSSKTYSPSVSLVSSGDVSRDLATVNQKMRDDAFLLGL